MSVMLPDNLVFVLNLIGFSWPTADEDKLKQSAQHWRDYATELEHVIADVNQIVEKVKAENSAESIDALEQHWRDFGEHLRKAHDAAGTVAAVLDDFALVVEGLKLKAAAQLLFLAGELAATTGAAFLTFGVAEAAAPEEIIATQGFMRWVTGVAIQKVEHLVADKVAKVVVEHFLSIKNGLKALKASPAALKGFGKGLVRRGGKDLEHSSGSGVTVLHDGAGATKEELAASVGGPTAGSRAGQAAVRQKLLDEAKGKYTCWRCGKESTNPKNMHLGHRNVPTSKGGNLEPVNTKLEGAACNLGAGNRGAPKLGKSCVERGGAGAPYGRFD